MPDVIVDIQLIQHLAFAVVPFGHHGVHINGGVDNALFGVILGVQRSQTDLHLLVQGVLEGDDRNTIGVCTLELFIRYGILDLRPAVYPCVAVSLPETMMWVPSGLTSTPCGLFGSGTR